MHTLIHLEFRPKKRLPSLIPFESIFWTLLFCGLVIQPLRAQDHGIELLGECGGPCTAIALQGTHAYLAEGKGLSIIDITDLAQPVWQSKILLPQARVHSFNIAAIAVAGDFAYIGDFASLQIINVSDPLHPMLRGVYDLSPYLISDISISGNLSYVSTASGLVTLDVTDPDHPVLAGQILSGKSLTRSLLTGNRIFMAQDDLHLRIADLTTPTLPRLIGDFKTSETIKGMAYQNNHAYLAGYSYRGLQVLGLNNLDTTPALASNSFLNFSGLPLDVITTETLALVARDALGLAVFQLDGQGSGTLLTETKTPGEATRLAFAGHVAAVADLSGVSFIDISNSAHPPLLGRYAPPVYSSDFVLAGDLAYIANDLGLSIVNIHDSVHPFVMRTCPLAAPLKNIAMDGNFLLVSDRPGVYQREGNRGLSIMSLADPTSPTTVSSLPLVAETNRIAAAGGLAFLAETDQFKFGKPFGHPRLEIIDFHNPAAPTQSAIFETTGSASDVAVAGTLACLADGDAGLRVFDVNNPTSPALRSTYTSLGAVWGVRIDHGQAFVTAGKYFAVLSLADPTSLTRVRTYTYAGAGRNSALALFAENKPLLPDDGDALQLYDTADPGGALPSNRRLLGGECSQLFVRDNLIFSSDNLAGLYIMHLTHANSANIDWFLAR